MDNYSFSPLARIWILHSPVIQIQVMKSSAQAMNLHVFSTQCHKYYFLSVIYASNSENERKSLWQELIDIKDIMHAIPLLVVGDFYTIKSMDERPDFYMGMPACRA